MATRGPSAGKTKAKGKNAGPTPVEAIRHKDKRTNIPTEELRDFVAEEEAAPSSMLYPRDPSLDPQLVWRGKDEQDRKPLEVPVLPVYIQEKIHPQALIENLRETAKAGEPEPELTLFNDFNGIDDFDKKVDFYRHDQNWSNRMILGDSLLVMTSLAEKEGLKGKVQTIYFDPPYGIDFRSNWQVSTRKRDVKDGKVEDATRQPEQVKAFRDTWKDGIHSYLSYLRDRLLMARELLTEAGGIFVQIGDRNVHVVRNLLDEVFGPDNFVVEIVFAKKANQKGALLESIADTIHFYSKDRERVKFRQVYVEHAESGADEFSSDLTGGGVFKTQVFPFEFEGRTFRPAPGNSWKTSHEGMLRLQIAGRILAKGSQVRYRRLRRDFGHSALTNIWSDTGGAANRAYVVETSPKVVQRCILMTSDPGDLVLDPTCGSGTTAVVAEQWGRRWITIDTSRVALALARTRLMGAKYPYHLLADSPEGIAKESEITGRVPPSRTTEGDVKKGFVYKRVPHVTLKSIANNPEIRDGMTREEIDRAIAKYADQETLFDQPFEDTKRLRVTGPFTVESLSPHRVLGASARIPAAERLGRRDSIDFVTTILDNLRKAGVQNTKKAERLVFERLEPFAGIWIHGEGAYTDASGASRRVAVSIGPEHGTVGPQQVKEAAKEAVQGVGFDVLVVCGFAFDPHVAEEATRYGKLQVLPVRMNPDLAMGEELLKKTGAGNLFMVFGEPDVEIAKEKDGRLVVEICGLDVYDPTTGEIRNSSTDDIACWFIDTDYNGESFFVRHAYFTGADEPYEKLKRALKAEIDEGAWSSLYSTKSRPFDRPASGKIAVKVINHYGDEVLKVFGV